MLDTTVRLGTTSLSQTIVCSPAMSTSAMGRFSAAAAFSISKCASDASRSREKARHLSAQTRRRRRGDVDLSQREQRKHAPGLSFFGAVRIVALSVASSAGAGVVNLFYAGGAALLNNVRREIDFVMGRSNARTQLHHQVLRVRSEVFPHRLNRLRRDCLLGPFFTGVNQTDRGRFGIDNVNRAAIGDVNSERDPSLIRDHPITVGEF